MLGWCLYPVDLQAVPWTGSGPERLTLPRLERSAHQERADRRGSWGPSSPSSERAPAKVSSVPARQALAAMFKKMFGGDEKK